MAEHNTSPAAVGAAGTQGRPAEGDPQGGGKVNIANVLKFSGAFVAFMIGSGYASGQEIMQFFTAYGIWSIGGLIIALVLFSWLGKVLMNYGYRHRELTPEQMPDQSFRYYCGKYFGTFLAWFIPVFLFLVCVVMTSGAGATLAQYFGLPTWVGALGMCVLVFVTNLFGFRRIVDIVGALGPLTIIFSIVIAVFAIASNPAGLANVASHADVFASMANATNGAPLWALAGLLYVAFNMTGSVPFLTQTGATAASAREAKWGAIGGGILFVVAGLLMNLALLCYIDDVSQLEVPVLFLSDLISPVVSVIFAIILLDEIYSTAAPMMWTSVNRFAPEGTKLNKVVLAGFSVLVLLIVLSPLSYGQLLGIVYPYTGYIGILFIICVIVRQCIERYNRSKGLDIETPLIFKK
ncbi:MAG: hypothetical protein KHY83_01360 [Coriobacteriia bacterium]|nr:hypothetical protein [Coriobacteriia bacterium]MBS5477298.1 hypothetical protein [Coriobacteriia bacterium]